jgi:hypothetical protein
MTVKVGDETDAFEDTIPVEVLASPETVAAYGERPDAKNVATEGLTIPAGWSRIRCPSSRDVFDSNGGTRGGCTISRRIPVWMRGTEGIARAGAAACRRSWDAFTLPGVDPSKMRPRFSKR